MDPTKLGRAKIQRILQESPGLAGAIERDFRFEAEGPSIGDADPRRISRVLLKLARGHVNFWCGEIQPGDPDLLTWAPIHNLSPSARSDFEAVARETLFPEVGSRAFSELLLAGEVEHPPLGWITTQAGRYRYLLSYSSGLHVRMVLSEHLACEVRWE